MPRMRDIRPRALPILLAALVVFLCMPGRSPFAWSETVIPAAQDAQPEAAAGELLDGPATTLPAQPTIIFMNNHESETVQAGQVTRYRFEPLDSDSYIFRSFPQADAQIPATRVQLLREADGAVLDEASGAGCFRLEADLIQGESYVLEIAVESDGVLVVEVMQNARGRCWDNPISLPGHSMRYAKTIVQPRDTHWFSFVAPTSGWYSIRTETAGESILDTRGYLMDAEGYILATNDDILFPGDANFMIQCELTAGQTYYLRIAAFSNETGPYRLVLVAPEEGQALPEAITLSDHQLMMDVDEEHCLSVTLRPGNALEEVVYASSDNTVVSVEPDGVIRALRAGEATVWAFSYGGIRDRCTVTVRPVEVTGMSFTEDSISLRMEETRQLIPVFEPANATLQAARYAISDERVAQVDENGLITAISEGEAVITATSMDGSFIDTLTVRVQGVRPVYRALVLGEYGYEDGERLGGFNTAQGVADMLSGQTMEGYGYEVHLQMDSTLEQVKAGIEQAFGGAAQSDISLLYINCHGDYEDGVAYLRLHDETRITAHELEEMLDAVPGRVVLLLDFCQSGAFLTQQGEELQAAFDEDKYVVIASAKVGEDSYRRSFGSDEDEYSTAAIMGRSLCEGAGWDLIYDRSVNLKADLNGDRSITVQEIFEYTKKRVAHYLKGTGAVQTVCLSAPEEDMVILGRS